MNGRRDDEQRDVHLRAALRHAPDRDAVPPAPLSEQILAQARRSVRPSDRLPWWRRMRAVLARAFDVLTRPAGAAAFASLALATVIGVMWREGPPPERTPAAASPEPAAELAAAPPPAAPAEPAGDSTAARTDTPSDSSATKPAVEPRQRAAPAGPTASPLAQRSQSARPPGGAAATSADAQRTDARARSEARKSQGATTAPPAGERAPATRPQAAAAPLTGAAPPAAPPPVRAAEQGMPSAAATAPAPAAPSPMPRAAPMAAAPDATATLRSSIAPSIADPLAPLLLELGREAAGAPSSTTHRWQRGSAPALPHGPAAQAWLVELQRATQGAWHATHGPSPAGANALVLSNERGTVAHLELTEGGVSWRSASPPDVTWRAALPDETLRRLRGSLAAWTGR